MCCCFFFSLVAPVAAPLWHQAQLIQKAAQQAPRFLVAMATVLIQEPPQPMEFLETIAQGLTRTTRQRAARLLSGTQAHFSPAFSWSLWVDSLLSWCSKNIIVLWFCWCTYCLKDIESSLVIISVCLFRVSLSLCYILVVRRLQLMLSLLPLKTVSGRFYLGEENYI